MRSGFSNPTAKQTSVTEAPFAIIIGIFNSYCSEILMGCFSIGILKSLMK